MIPVVRVPQIPWRCQLSVFGNVVADLVNANASTLVDAWFAAWSETNPAARE